MEPRDWSGKMFLIFRNKMIILFFLKSNKMNTMMSSVVINVQLLGRNAHQLDAECKSLNKWDPHGSKRFYRIGVYGLKSDASDQVISNTKDQIQAYELGFIHFLSFSHNFTVTSNMCEFTRLNHTSPKAELIKNGSYLLFTLIFFSHASKLYRHLIWTIMRGENCDTPLNFWQNMN